MPDCTMHVTQAVLNVCDLVCMFNGYFVTINKKGLILIGLG